MGGDTIFAAARPKASTYYDRCTPHQSAPYASQFVKKWDVPHRIGRTKGGLDSKLHTVCDQDGKPICLLLSEGQMSDYQGAALLLPILPDTQELIADYGYDANWFRQVLFDRNIMVCIPHPRCRTTEIPFDRQTYRLHHKIENLFAKFKNRRRIVTRYDRCAHTFFSAICIAATANFYRN